MNIKWLIYIYPKKEKRKKGECIVVKKHSQRSPREERIK